ncbi:hypothetical protein [Sporomusa sphaeroides]|uniref:hypothetical protein n=1 Tax=Sporomusa sphaeroides TaxID=47679 RepID=UPI00315984E6
MWYMAYIVLVALGFLVVEQVQPDWLISYGLAAGVIALAVILYNLRWVLFSDLCTALEVSKTGWDILWDKGVHLLWKKAK